MPPRGRGVEKSGRPDSNRLPSAWKADVQPVTPRPRRPSIIGLARPIKVDPVAPAMSEHGPEGGGRNWRKLAHIGAWRSLVARSAGGRKVASSNLAAPTSQKPAREAGFRHVDGPVIRRPRPRGTSRGTKRRLRGLTVRVRLSTCPPAGRRSSAADHPRIRTSSGGSRQGPAGSGTSPASRRSLWPPRRIRRPHPLSRRVGGVGAWTCRSSRRSPPAAPAGRCR
jgi:hypothetical protein